MKIFGIFTWFLVSIFVGALLNSWAFHSLWRWFLAQEYGAGPSMGAWFGISMIVHLMLIHLSLARDTDKGQGGDSDRLAAKLVQGTLTRWSFVLLSLGVAWVLGQALGWVR